MVNIQQIVGFNFSLQFQLKWKVMHFSIAVKGLKVWNQVSKFTNFIHSRILMSFNKYMNWKTF